MTSHDTPPVFTLPAALLSAGYALRPETDDDIPFLLQLYASTRADELALVDWSAAQKLAFVTSSSRRNAITTALTLRIALSTCWRTTACPPAGSISKRGHRACTSSTSR